MQPTSPIIQSTDPRRQFLSGLYGDLLENGIRYFFPGAMLQRVTHGAEAMPGLVLAVPKGGEVTFEWMGTGYSLTAAANLSEHERRLLRSIGIVLSTRYQTVTNQVLAAQSFQILRGQPEDRFVSAFLDPGPHASAEAMAHTPDRVADAIEVLRTSSMSTYENRRIATGVLLFGSMPEPCHEPPRTPAGALRYTSLLTTIRSFHRLCDGLQTLALVDKDGHLAELIDVHEWAEPYRDLSPAVPSATAYEAHARATLCGGHICLILSPNGEIKIYSDGIPVFRFIDGKWRLMDARYRYEMWKKAAGNVELAERLFRVAMNLAETRRGALFVVLDDHESVRHLVTQSDLLDHVNHEHAPDGVSTKDQLHYLLRNKSVFDIPATVLENIARIDGAVVLCSSGHLLAFGAILHHHSTEEAMNRTIEGGRTIAALAASRYGTVLKISEDGLISMFRQEQCLWEM